MLTQLGKVGLHEVYIKPQCSSLFHEKLLEQLL